MEPKSTFQPKNLEILFVNPKDENEKTLFQNLSLSMFDALHERNYEAFDAHVGDKACQCRAFMLIDIVTKHRLSDLMDLQSSEIVNQAYITLMQMFLTHYTRSQKPLPNFDFVDTSDPSKLRELSSNLGQKKCESINNKAQKQLAIQSVELTKRLLNEPHLETFYDANRRPLLHTYIHIRALIKEIKKRNIPIVILRVFKGEPERETLIFEKNEATSKHQYVPVATKPSIAFCIEGEADRGGQDEIKLKSITKIIKLIADHYAVGNPLPHTLFIKHIRACAI